MSPNENGHFEFRKEDHSYWLDGVQIPSATQIIKLCGLIDDRWYKPEHRTRGTLVHAGCHHISENDMDWKQWEEAHPELLGYLRAYEKFLADSGFKPTICEKPHYHENLRYGVTVDNIGTSASALENEIVELKSGSMMRWTALQTALQAMAWFSDSCYTIRRTGVELHSDGTYRTESFANANDFPVVTGMVGVAHWKLENFRGGHLNGSPSQ